VTTYDAILPAGGEIDPAFADKVGTNNKALIELGGKPMVARVVQALRDSGRVRRIAVIGPAEVQEVAKAHGADLVLEQGLTGPDNIMNGLAALQAGPEPPHKVVVATSDLPFLTPDLVRRFIDSCPTDTDICLPLVTKAEYQARFPNSTATFIPLADGVWTAGCLYLLDTQALLRAKPHIDRIFAVRKSKLGMAKLLGPGFLLKFLTKKLAVPDIETKIRSLLDCSGRAIPGSAPELAFDIDYLDDYEYALTQVERA
jgi:GTP:adenosylcobinamide-phosphate guanylyltransferase